MVAGVASAYQAGRDLDPTFSGSGKLLHSKIVRSLCERGIRQMDLLRDDEPYKREWADNTRTMVGVEAAHGARARAVLAAMPAARGAYGVARRGVRLGRRAIRRVRPGRA